jgi:hypothetical protein
VYFAAWDAGERRRFGWRIKADANEGKVLFHRSDSMGRVYCSPIKATSMRSRKSLCGGVCDCPPGAEATPVRMRRLTRDSASAAEPLSDRSTPTCRYVAAVLRLK